jgi:hypothetical protein
MHGESKLNQTQQTSLIDLSSAISWNIEAATRNKAEPGLRRSFWQSLILPPVGRIRVCKTTVEVICCCDLNLYKICWLNDS